MPFTVAGREIRWAVGDQAFAQTWAGAPHRLRLSSLSGRDPIGELALSGDLLVLARSNGWVHTETPGRDAVRVLAAGHMDPSLLTIDAHAIYFVDMGYVLTHPLGPNRADCCKIWAAPR